MKKLGLFTSAVALLVSASVFASEALPQRVLVVALDNVSGAINKVEIENTGLMTIYYRGLRRVTQQKLSSANTDRILNDAFALSNAEIQTTKRDIVCKMLIGPYQPVLQVSESVDDDQFTGELRDILSAQSCAMPVVFEPKDTYLQTLAERLKETMLTLTNEYAATPGRALNPQE